MSEYRHTPEMPETTFSAAEKKVAEYKRTVEKANATLDLLHVDTEVLESLIEEAIHFEEVANSMNAIDIAFEQHEQAMFDVEALVELRNKMKVIRAGRAKVEETIARIEAADAKLTAWAAEHGNKSAPAN